MALRKKVSVSSQGDEVEMPAHVHLTGDELAVVTRLVRAMRQKRDPRSSRGDIYWLGPFIEWLLYLDISDPQLRYVSPVHVANALVDMGGFECIRDGGKFMRAALKQCPGLRFVSGSQPPDDRPGTIQPALPDEEEQFYELIRLWRMEHPEPSKPRTFPKGRTQHECDPDTD